LIHLTPYPNLVVSNVDAPASANSDDEIEISWTVSNTGGVSTSSPIWYDKVYLSSTTGPGGYILGEFENLSYLDTGESYVRQNQTVTIPKQVADGTYYIVVLTDSRNHVDEQINEGDNFDASASFPVQYVVYERPDLVVTNFVSPYAGWAGNPMSLSWTVENQGTAPASGAQIVDWVWLSTENEIDPHNATHIGGSYIGSHLDPGESYEQNVSITLPDTADGDYYLYVWTDVTLNFDDSDLDNNFNPEVGFVPRVGVRRSKVHLEYNPRPQRFGIRMMEPMWNVTFFHDHSGRLVSRQYHHMVGTRFDNGAYLNVMYNRWFEVIDTRGYIEEGEVSYYQVTIRVGFTVD